MLLNLQLGFRFSYNYDNTLPLWFRKCTYLYSITAPRNNTTLLKDHASLHNLVWRITSPISLFVCTIAFIFQIKEIKMLPTVTSEKKMELILIIDATAFAAISAFIQTFIYYLNNAAYCTVLGALFQVLLSCTIFIAVLLSLYLKFCNSSLNLKCSSLRPEYIIAVLAIAVAIAVVIAPVISGSYGDAGGWCWIKHTDGNGTPLVKPLVKYCVWSF